MYSEETLRLVGNQLGVETLVQMVVNSARGDLAVAAAEVRKVEDLLNKERERSAEYRGSAQFYQDRYEVESDRVVALSNDLADREGAIDRYKDRITWCINDHDQYKDYINVLQETFFGVRTWDTPVPDKWWETWPRIAYKVSIALNKTITPQTLFGATIEGVKEFRQLTGYGLKACRAAVVAFRPILEHKYPIGTDMTFLVDGSCDG